MIRKIQIDEMDYEYDDTNVEDLNRIIYVLTGGATEIWFDTNWGDDGIR